MMSVYSQQEVTNYGVYKTYANFFRIFDLSPATQQMFKKFSDISIEEVEENEHFRSHALQVTESVSLAVSSLDDMESLVLILKDLGGAHSTHNLQNSHFDVSCLCMLARRE